MAESKEKERPKGVSTGCGSGCADRKCGGGSCAACSHRADCSCPRADLAGRGNLDSYDWLAGIKTADPSQFVEVMFKNTRKSYYLNTANLQLRQGDAVVVEGSPGQDLGKVTMTGPLVALQMRRASLRKDFEPKRIYRHATESDMERFRAARDREHDTMIRSRQIAAELGLKMKIGDVEYQGDGHKAIFYYIADERVDFRKLIRILAETFGVRVEMKQIGARQEAGRIGGIGPCGRPLCCATFLSKFASVGTGAARLQDISMNPQKLAGQCAKLKCCLNFEVDSYVEAGRKLPPKDVQLQTKDADYFYFKADILKREITYSTAKNQPVNLVVIPAARAFEIISLNKQGIKVDALSAEEPKAEKPKEFVDLVGQDSLTRFDKNRRKKKRGGGGGEKPTDADKGGKSGRQRQSKSDKLQKGEKGKTEQTSAKDQPRQQPKGGAGNGRKPRQPRHEGKQGGDKPQQPRQEKQEKQDKQSKPRQQKSKPSPVGTHSGASASKPKLEPKPKQESKPQIPAVPDVPVSQLAIRMATKNKT